MSKVKGVIFDFNGTLFWDSLLHEKAWKEFALKYAGKHLTSDDFKHSIHGRINRDILRYVFGKTITDDEVMQYSEEKESLYRSYLLKDRSLLELAPGANEMLDYLKAMNIPMTIATSAETSNVNFYVQELNLPKWFEFSKIVYDDGTIVPKPAPDIFLKAASNLKLEPSECIVVEDSMTGIMAAKNAGTGTILLIENDESADHSKVKEWIDGRITNLLDLKEFL